MLSASGMFAASLGSCTSAGSWSTNVLTELSYASGLNNTCTLGNIEVGNFIVSNGIGGQISLNPAAPSDPDGPLGTHVSGSTGYLNFEFNPQGPGPTSYNFYYAVWAHEGYSLVGLDAEFGVGSGMVQLTETACKVFPSPGCSEANSLGSLFIDMDPATTTIGRSGSFDFSPQAWLWVGKDLTIGANSGLSDLFNSHHWQRDSDVPEVPEPATMLLFSTALLGLGYMRRKRS